MNMSGNACKRGLAIAAVLAFGLPTVAQAGTIYVDAAMSDDTGNGLTPETAKLTIGAGITASAAGDTVEVNAGVYLITGQLLINKQVTLMAKAGLSAKPRIRTNVTDSWTACNVQIAADNVVIDGFEIDNALNSSNNAQAGYLVGDWNSAKNGWTVRNCSIHNGRNGIRVMGNYVTIEGNDIYSTYGDCINGEYGQCGGLKVTRNILHAESTGPTSGGSNPKPAGITYSCYATTVGDVEISYNICYASRTFIDFQHSSSGLAAPANNIVIKHNTVDWKMEALPASYTGTEVAQKMSVVWYNSSSSRTWLGSKFTIRDNIFSRQLWFPVNNCSEPGAGKIVDGGINLQNNLFFGWHLNNTAYPGDEVPITEQWPNTPGVAGAVGWRAADDVDFNTSSDLQGDPKYSSTGTTAGEYYALTAGSPALSAATDGLNIGVWQGTPTAPVTDVYVSSAMADDGGDGLTPETAKQSIQSGIALVDAGGTVHVATGTYIGDLDLTKSLSLAGSSAVIDGDVTFAAAVTMTGITLDSGHDWHVTTNGSIQSAINAALTGATINVAAATYLGDLTANKALTIIGSSAVIDGDVTFDANPISMTGLTLASGHDWHVTANGSIQAAMSAAAIGNTVNVAAATYTGDLDLTKELTLTGSSAVIDGDVTFSAAVTLTGVTPASGHDWHVTAGGSIQSAITAAAAGATVNVAAGTYTETLTLSKRVIVQGAGSGLDGTILAAVAPDASTWPVGVLNLTAAASGLSDAEPLTLQDLRIAAVDRAGISVGRFKESTGVAVSYVKLDNVKVIGSNDPLHQLSINTELERGLYVDLTSSLEHLTVTHCSFDNLTYGWYFQKAVSADTSTVRYVCVEDSTLSHNNNKGIYAEKLSDTTFTRCTVADNDFVGATHGATMVSSTHGLELNLKAGSYANFLFDDCTITGNGIGGAREGCGLAIKARDDAPSYSTFPAMIDGVVIRESTITGNERGIRIGEPAKNNASPTNVTIQGCTISGNTQCYIGSDGSAYGGLVNHSLTTVNATNNYWGATNGPFNAATNPSGSGNAVSANVLYAPWLGATPGTTPMTYGAQAGADLQKLVSAASAGDTIQLAAGTYTGDLLLDKALTFSGSDVVIDGDVTFSAVVSLTGVTLASGHVCNVVPGGSIQAAVNAAPVGGTVNIANGLYKESNIAIAKTLTLQGASKANVVIAPAANDSQNSGDYTGTAQQGLIVVAHGVTIRDLMIDGDANNLANGGTLTNQHNFRTGIITSGSALPGPYNNLTVQNVVVRNAVLNGISLSNTASGGHMIASNFVENIAIKHGIYSQAADATVTGNTIRGVGMGILFSTSVATPSSKTTTITDNTLYDIAGSYSSYYNGTGWPSNGIYYRNPDVDQTVIITGNHLTIGNGAEVDSPGVCGLYIYNTDATSRISDNTIDATAGTNNWGLYLGGSAGTTVDGNTFTMNESDSGIYLGRGVAGTPVANIISNNTFTSTGSTSSAIEEGVAILQSNDGGGFWLNEIPYDTRSTITGNTISGFVRGIALLEAASGEYVQAGTTVQATLHNNLISGNTSFGVDASTLTSVIDATYNCWGASNGPFNAATNPAGTGNAVSANVTFSPWWANAALTIESDGIEDTVVTDTVIEDTHVYGDLHVVAGMSVTVSDTGTLNVDKLELGEGSTITVNGGSLELGDGSVISGTFTIFNSFGSWNIDGDTTFDVTQSLALISDIHIAAGKTLTVNGGGEFIFDGCVIASQTPGSTYNITAATDGLLTLARCVVTDANIDINTTLAGNLKSRVYDSSFTTSDIEASTVAKVYHNLLDAATNAAANTDATAAFAAIDGWANVTSADALQNKFTLDFAAPTADGRTLDASGNLFVQPDDAVVMKMDVAALASNITTAEALLGYNSAMLAVAGPSTSVTPLGDWEVIEEAASVPGDYGYVDSALGMKIRGGDDTSGTIAQVNFTAGNPGLTVGFFRVQTNRAFYPDGTLVQDTRLTGPAPTFDFVTAFTANTGELIIDDQSPTIAESSANATQVQVNSTGPVDVLDATPTVSPNYVFRNEDNSTPGYGKPVILTFTATDAGLAGLETATADATDDLVLTAGNGTTSLAYTVTASGTTTVTYTVTLAIPVTATTGTYAVSATVRDRSGNVSDAADLGSFQIANEVLATVQLEGFVGTLRVVTFAATGGTTKTWTKTVTLTPGGLGATGSVPLEDVPAGTTAISAKTAWNLRSKLDVSFSGVGVGAAALTGDDRLPGGDLNSDNVVNTRDYAVLRYYWGLADPTADITGDGEVDGGDYNQLRYNFYTIGDAQ
jgi:putative cofactor-binding repeat protein